MLAVSSRLARFAPFFLPCCLLLSLGASWRSANFIVEARDPRVAQRVGEAAEAQRRDLAVAWLGSELPRWSAPCPITVEVAPHLGAGGATSFLFDHGEVFGWQMNIQGSEERVLDSVLPHEITHTIFASHFRRPLPRWADEGACSTVEHSSEREKQQRLLIEFLQTRRGIAFSDLFAMRDYPPDVLPLYCQGHSLANYLIQQGGRRKFVEFLGSGLRDENWPAALQQHYGVAGLGRLQDEWLAWVRAGSPAIAPRPQAPSIVAPHSLLAENSKAPSAATLPASNSAPTSAAITQVAARTWRAKNPLAQAGPSSTAPAAESNSAPGQSTLAASGAPATSDRLRPFGSQRTAAASPQRAALSRVPGATPVRQMVLEARGATPTRR